MNTEATVGFGLKAYLKIMPFYSLAIGILLVIVFFGLGTKIFEFYNMQIMDLLDSSSGAVNAG